MTGLESAQVAACMISRFSSSVSGIFMLAVLRSSACLGGLPRSFFMPYRLPAAMAAGVVDELWDFERLYDEVMGA